MEPSTSLPLANYTAPIRFLDETHPTASVEVPFNFRAISSATGSVSVAVYDDFSTAPGFPTVSNVSVRLYDRISDSLLQTLTDADGRFTFADLPVGPYAIEMRADGHASSWQTFTIVPGDQEQLDVFLPSEVVRYSWVVVPTTTQDRYLVSLEATFQTEVPIPVVTITPSPVDLRSLDLIGETVVVPLTITNHGLVAARDLSFVAPIHPNYSILLLDDIAGLTLPAEESLQVNLRLERIADDPNAPCSIGLGELYWDYGTFLPNQIAPITVERDTPLPFLIDSHCVDAPGGPLLPGGGGGLWGFGEVITVPLPPIPLPYVTARVKIRINQEMVLSRDAFEGTFVLENLDPSIDLSAIDIDLEIYDEDGNLVTDRFAITSPTLFGFGGALDGSGSLAAATSGTAVYTILAKDTAAPIEPTRYSIGGRVAYSRADGSVNFNLAPAAITVLPQPVLALDYFLQRDVFSDDPFTSPLKEASQPFVLGLLAHNRGYGVANDLAITSAQPEIIENELGLKIGFELIGAAVNGNPVLPSLAIDLGDLAAHSTSEAHWLMTSTLQGRFIDYKASFEYVNGLGLKDVPGLSQLTSVTLHELTRRVRDHRTGADTRHDYLVNSNPPVVAQNNAANDLLPDILYLSNDTTEPVIALPPGSPGLAISAIDAAGEASLSVNAASGWTYLRLIEPSDGSRPITAIRRSDGSLLSPDNYWVTDRTFPENGLPTYESSLHILDFNPTGGLATYTVAFGAVTGNTAPTVVVTIADQKAKETVPFFFIVPSPSFLDTDAGDSLSYAASLDSGAPLPAWLSFDGATRTFSGTPGATDVTTLQVRVTATDRAGLSVSDTFSLLVEPANYAPIVSAPIPDQTISTGAPYTYALPPATFSDPDPADTLTYTASRADGTPLPAWLSFNPATRTFSGTPADADAASLSLTVTATDLAAAAVSDTFSLTVSDTAPPVITSITAVGTQLQLTFSEAIVTTGLTASRFSATVAGVARTVASVAAVSGDPTRLNLTLSGAAPTSTQALAVRYTDLTAADNLTGVVQDANGLDMATIAAPGRNVDTFSSAASVASLASSYTNLLLTGTAATGSGNAGNNRLSVNQATAVAAAAVTPSNPALSNNAAAAPNGLSITGNGGANTLIGTAFNDTITGGAGADTSDGGEGADLYLIASSADHPATEVIS
ncbi:MAG: putative Ig domain-containing protein, partial [Cyanobium sp.]